MLRCCMTEPSRPSEAGSIGPYMVAEAARRAGHHVDMLPWDAPRHGYDVEMVSVHHVADYPRLLRGEKQARVRIIGGHVTFSNPRPVIPLADYICMGDGEEWIVPALEAIEAGREVDLPGTIVSRHWRKGSPLPRRNVCQSPRPVPYLNREGTRSASWYIEIARGCPFSCAYCELGHSMPYRPADADAVRAAIDRCDRKKAGKITFFAPDEASHPAYADLLDHASARGFRQRFGSYRLDQVIRHGGLPVDGNQLVRVGIDGMTEATRMRVGKRITNAQIVEYFQILAGQGHTSFKVFQMLAHPWERLEDFNEWEAIMEDVRRIPVRKSVYLRIKWTPLIPQPCTPLAETVPRYSLEMAERIMLWHEDVRQPPSDPGWYIGLDGLMSRKSHREQVAAVCGDEEYLVRRDKGLGECP